MSISSLSSLDSNNLDTSNIAWPHHLSDYEWKGTISSSSSSGTTKILARCLPKKMDVIIVIKNMELMWDVNSSSHLIESYFKSIHGIMNISSSHILSPVHTFQYQRNIFIIYKLLSGGLLNQLFNNYTKYKINGLLDEDIIATILYDCINALNSLHLHNLVHNNISLSSLHIHKLNGKTLLTNFHNRNTKNTLDSVYIDPELINNDIASLKSGDIYSFGVLAMVLCYGYPPFNISNQRASINDYNKQFAFSNELKNLIENCLKTSSNRITIKQILCDEFFNNRKCFYDKVRNLIAPLKSTEYKINLDIKYSKLNKQISKLNDNILTKKATNNDNIVIDDDNDDDIDDDDDDTWNFDLDLDQFYDNDNNNTNNKSKIKLNDVIYDDINDIDDDNKINGNNHNNNNNKYYHNIQLSNQSILSALSPLSHTHRSSRSKSKTSINSLNSINSNSNHNNNNNYIRNDIIKLNVGGIMYQTTLNTLRKYPDNMLYSKFSGNYDIEYDENTDSYFIDRDGKYFKYILNYLRNGKLIIPKANTANSNNNNNDLFYAELYAEACYYQIRNIINILNPENIYFYSTILPNIYYVNIFKKWINNNNNNINNQKWKLLYRASLNGFESTSFHRNCDLYSNTLTLIHANNKIFGGYTPIPWKSNNYNEKYYATKNECINTFIFNMDISDNNNNINAFKWNFIDKYYNSYSGILPVAHLPNIGATFGWYHVIKSRNIDNKNNKNNNNNKINSMNNSNNNNKINNKTNNNNNCNDSLSQNGILISDKCNINNNSCWTFCAYFNTPKSSNDLAGSKNFFVKDIEVYHINYEVAQNL